MGSYDLEIVILLSCTSIKNFVIKPSRSHDDQKFTHKPQSHCPGSAAGLATDMSAPATDYRWIYSRLKYGQVRRYDGLGAVTVRSSVVWP